MTRNQIEYWRNIETERQNRAALRETKRHNRAMLEETERSNLARERENERSNRAREEETRRSNQANEAIRSQTNSINMYLGERSAGETEFHNRRMEGMQVLSQDIERQRVDLGYQQAAVNREIGLGNVGVGYANVAEAQRSHQAQEAEQHRSNLVNEYVRIGQNEIARQNATTNARNANASNLNAETNARRQTLDENKWYSALLPNTLANTTLIKQQTKTQYSQEELNNSQSINTRVNAFTNLTSKLVQGAVTLYGGVR